jgi:toxin HigB-1
VIRSFRDRGTQAVFDGLENRSARQTCSPELWPAARRKLDLINRASDLRNLSLPPGNRLERLKGTRIGQHSIRINGQYRICFRWEDGDAFEVEIADYH